VDVYYATYEGKRYSLEEGNDLPGNGDDNKTEEPSPMEGQKSQPPVVGKNRGNRGRTDWKGRWTADSSSFLRVSK